MLRNTAAQESQILFSHKWCDTSPNETPSIPPEFKFAMLASYVLSLAPAKKSMLAIMTSLLSRTTMLGPHKTWEECVRNARNMLDIHDCDYNHH